MTDDDRTPDPEGSRGFSRRRLVQGAAGGLVGFYGSRLAGRPAAAVAAEGVPNAISVENARAGATAAFKLDAGKYNSALGGYTDRASVDKGGALSVKINSYAFAQGAQGTTASLEIYRLGYYGGAGGRLVRTISNVTLTNQGFVPAFTDLGWVSADDTWNLSVDIDTSGFETGVYLIKIVTAASAGGGQAHIPFVVRDDSRPRDILFLLPTNTYQAYNSWPGKCLYNNPSYDNNKTTQLGVDANGRSRAAKVSFDRSFNNVYDDLNWVLRTEFPLIYWLERMGYDVSYTEDVAYHATSAAELRPNFTKVIAIAGHAEYWTQEMFAKTKAARDAGVSIASFSANAAYWKVRYEDAQRTLVCFKTVQGTTANGADLGKDGVNDYGPVRADGATGGRTARGGTYDPLRFTGNTGSAYATTTFRDPGANASTPNAPDGLSPRTFEGNRRVGPNSPENELWGVMYMGDHDNVSYPLQVPAGSGSGGEFGAHPAWRHTTVASGSGASIGNQLVGWEWDAIPGSAYASKQPANVKRLSETDVKSLVQQVPSANQGGFGYLQDNGRAYLNGPTATSPPSISNGKPNAVTYKAASGATVFAAGTMQWSFGLGPHFDSIGARTYEDPPVDASEPAIQQATYNILTDMGVAPATRVGVISDAEAAAASQPPSSGGGGSAPAPAAPSPGSGTPVVAKPDTTPPKLALKGGRRRISKKGEVALRATASKASKRPFSGKFVLHMEIPQAPRNGKKRKAKRVKIATVNQSFVAGQSRVVEFKVPKRYRALLAKKRRLGTIVEVRVTDTKGNTAKVKDSFWLLSRPK